MNVVEVKKRMLELDISAKDWAECLGVGLQQAYRKIKGTSPLTLVQAEKIQNLLHIEDADFAFYFLNGHSRVS